MAVKQRPQGERITELETQVKTLTRLVYGILSVLGLILVAAIAALLNQG